MGAQRLIAAGLILRSLGFEIAERRRKAVTAMLKRCAAQGPERVLQAFGQGNEALAAQHDVRKLPVRERQAEVVQPVLKWQAGDAHAEVGGVSEIR